MKRLEWARHDSPGVQLTVRTAWIGPWSGQIIRSMGLTSYHASWRFGRLSVQLTLMGIGHRLRFDVKVR